MDGANHFSVLQPISKLIGKKILADSGANPSLDISEADIKAAMGR